MGLTGASFHMDADFSPAYRPSGEVLAFRFSDAENLRREPEETVGVCALYQDLKSDFSGSG